MFDIPFSVFVFWIALIFFIIFSIKKNQGRFHFPFFATIAIASFFGPQINSFGLFENGYDFELATFVIITLLSLLAIYVGFYGFNKPIKYFNVENSKITRHKNKNVIAFLYFMLLLSLLSFLKLVSNSGGLSNYLYRSYSIVSWTGEAVWLTFFIQFLYLIFPTALFFTHFSKNRHFKIITLLSILIPLLYIIFLNRRFVFFNIGLTIFLYLALIKKIKIGFIKLALLVLTSLFVINIFPLLRGEDVSFVSILMDLESNDESVLISNKYGEIKNGVFVAFSSINSGELEYGLGLFKQVFKDYVPGALIGKDYKIELLGSDKMRQLVMSDFKFLIPSHEFVTGVSWVTYQFGILGFIFWLTIGNIFGKVWNKISKKNSLKALIIYTCIVPIGLTAIVYSPGVALSLYIKMMLFVMVLFYANRLVYK